MSFLIKMGDGIDKDQRLAMVRKKYFHSILEYNQHFQKEKQQTENTLKQQSNQKFTRINQSAIQALQMEIAAKQEQKMASQKRLRVEYERQIRERRERILQEKEGEKKYVQLQLKETDKATERRVADLLKIYDRAAVKSTQRRTKTEMDVPLNPQSAINTDNKVADCPNVQSFRRMPFLPSIDKIQATVPTKNKTEETGNGIMRKSQRSFSTFTRR